MALADTDIYEAIKNKNYKLFIDQCLDKGIISSNTFLSKNFYADQIEAICQNENFKKFSNQLLANNGLRSASISDSDAVLSPILIAALVLAVGVAVTVVAVFWVTVALSYNDDSGNIEVIDVLTLRPGMENTYIAVDDYTEELVNTSISIINEASPAYFESHSEIETRNLLKINMINNM